MRIPRSMFTTMSLVPFVSIAIGCGGGTFADISGSVEGVKLNATSFYHGGPFLVFTSRESECLDMAWVERGSKFSSGEEPPTDYDMVSLLFTYANDEVVAENVSVDGQSLVDARLIVVSGGAMTVYDTAGGFIDVTEIDKKDHVIGNFDLSFDNGSLQGDFEVEYCNNLKADR